MGVNDQRRAVLLAVDDDADALDRIAGELRQRYGSRLQRPLRALAPTRARGARADARGGRPGRARARQPVAGRTTPARSCSRYVKHVHPRAKRGLMVDFGDWGIERTAEAILSAMALGHIDYYVLKPWASPDEFFHRTITEFLHEWRRHVGQRHRGGRGRRRAVVAAGARAHHAAEPQRRSRTSSTRATAPRAGASCASARARTRDVPVVRHPRARSPRSTRPRGAGSHAPTASPRSSTAHATSTSSWSAPGPPAWRPPSPPPPRACARWSSSARRSAARPGSSSLIRNYPGFSRGVSGAELAQRAYQQAWVFGAKLLLTQSVIGMQALGRPPRGRALRRQPGDRARRGARHRRVLPAARHPRARGAERRRRLLRRVGLGCAGAHRPGRVHRRRRQLGRPGRDAPAPLRAPRVHRRARHRRSRTSMSQYLRDTIAAQPDDIEVLLDTEVVGGGGEGRLAAPRAPERRRRGSGPSMPRRCS